MTVQVEQRNFIRPLREERGLSVRELAEKAGLGVATISAAELPQRSPRFETAQRIAEALGVAVTAIYAGH